MGDCVSRSSACLVDDPVLTTAPSFCVTPRPRPSACSSVRNAAAPATSADAQIESLGWDVGETLGAGAFGTVKRAVRREDQQVAAVKILRLPTQAIERDLIETEKRALMTANHDCIVKCFEYSRGGPNRRWVAGRS
jgi:serine/threonine protein kinase